MSMMRCGAQLKLAPGLYATCTRYVDAHAGLKHLDATSAESVTEWEPCSQHCPQGHAHGRYRLHIGSPGIASATLASRAPKKDKAKRGNRVPCKVCFEPGELEQGRCKDQAACAARAPQLDLGLEGP